MDAVLMYFYTGEVYVDSLQVEDFLNVALGYQFMDRELKSKIEDEILISWFDVQNAAELLILAYDYNLDKFYDNILEFVFDHRAELVKSNGYKKVIEVRSDFFFYEKRYYSGIWYTVRIVDNLEVFHKFFVDIIDGLCYWTSEYW